MSWFRGATLGFLLVTVLAAAPAVSAHGDEMVQLKQSKLLQELNLTSQQKQRINELRQRMRPQVQTNKQAIAKAKQELAALQAANASATKIQAKQKQLQALQKSTDVLRNRYIAAMKEILTTEQWAKLQKIKQVRQGSRGSEE